MPYQREEMVTASEVARYVYCQRAWWYDHEQIRAGSFKRHTRSKGRVGKGQVNFNGQYAERLNRQLVSYDFGVTGRPDYVIDHDQLPVPVLRKMGRAPEAPYDSHVAQILVHCLLIETTLRVPPPYGIVRYNDRTFEVDYDPPAYDALMHLLHEIRAEKQQTSAPHRSHEIRRRCFGCGHQNMCQESLVPSD